MCDEKLRENQVFGLHVDSVGRGRRRRRGGDWSTEEFATSKVARKRSQKESRIAPQAAEEKVQKEKNGRQPTEKGFWGKYYLQGFNCYFTIMLITVNFNG